jgi:hypothetical protein
VFWVRLRIALLSTVVIADRTANALWMHFVLCGSSGSFVDPMNTAPFMDFASNFLSRSWIANSHPIHPEDMQRSHFRAPQQYRNAVTHRLAARVPRVHRFVMSVVTANSRGSLHFYWGVADWRRTAAQFVIRSGFFPLV